MMTFYLQPPSGSVSYQKLEDFGLNRFRFLARLVACKDAEEREEALLDAETVNWSDCLIAGSVKDKISHYILRLAAGHDVDYAHFLCDAEAILFRMRLDSFTPEDWLSFFRTLERQSSQHQCDSLTDVHVLLNALSNGCMSWPCIVDSIKKVEDESMCVRLPFQLVLRLVGGRRVVINQGYASVPLCLMPDVLQEIFHRLMMKMVHQTPQQELKSSCADSRMTRLSAIIKRDFRREVNLTPTIPFGSIALTLDSMTSSQTRFPLCMSRLMTTLQKHHRLCHQDRIQLTLFLKELGLPLHQALLFWKREYSKPSVARLNGADCGHDWRGNERRYIYNIRHLYGLEGKRVSYVAHSCSSIQNRQLSCLDCGGCPFTSLESSALSKVLSKQSITDPDIEDIVQHVESGHVGQACRMTTWLNTHQEADFDNLSEGCDLHAAENNVKVHKKPFSRWSFLSGRNCKKSSRSSDLNLQHNCGHSESGIYDGSISRRFLRSESEDEYNIQPSETGEKAALVEKESFGCSEREASFVYGVREAVNVASQKRCIREANCDGCTKKRKLLHSRIEGCSKRAKDGAEINNQVAAEFLEENLFEICLCGLEIKANLGVESRMENSHCSPSYHTAEGGVNVKGFQFERYSQQIKSSNGADKCCPCKCQKDFKCYNSACEKSESTLIFCSNNFCDSTHCRKEFLYKEQKNSHCRECYDDTYYVPNVMSKPRRYFSSGHSHRAKPSSIYWDICSVTDR